MPRCAPWAAGPQIVKGYWNKPEATAETFIDGWVRTGDLAKLDDEGYCYIVDRAKDMIISGGSNIYPREVEEVLLLHPGVLEASIVGRPHHDWGEEVVAFVVVRPGHSPSAEEFDAICMEHIARYKRPKEYVFLAELPKSDYGKVLKSELRKLLEEALDTNVLIDLSASKVRFTLGGENGVVLTSKLIDGTFPDYTRVIPTGNTRRLEVDAAEFAKAVDRVATVSSERSRAVKLTLEDDRLILSVNAPDSGAAEEELAVAYDAERLEIGFNAKYLLEIAGQVDRENAVFLFNTSGDPTLMREGNDMSATYVVMPMRV